MTAQEVQEMVAHWLRCPVNGRLGSGYGSTLSDALMTPISEGAADAALAKLREDIPIVGALGSGAVNMYSQDVGPDRIQVVIDVAGIAVPGPVSAGV